MNSSIRLKLAMLFGISIFLSTAFMNCSQFTANDSAKSNLASSDGSYTPPDPPGTPDAPGTVGKPSACGSDDRYFPSTATRVPVAQAAQLQQILTTNKVVRLDAGNYGVSLTLRSGQQLYGIPGRTILNSVTVEPGTTGSLLRGVITSLNFPPSEVSTHDNCFSMIEGGVTVNQGTLDNNLFLSAFQAGIDLDTSTGGALRYNKFLRMQTHDAGFNNTKAALSVVGDTALKSTGNTFVFVNHLTPRNTPILFQNQNEISLLAADIEDYDVLPGTEATLTAKNVKKLRVMDLQGGVVQGMLDVGAEDFLLLGHVFYRAANPPVVLRANNQRTVWLSGAGGLNGVLRDENPGGTRVSGEWGSSGLNFVANNSTVLTAARSVDALSVLQSTPAGTTPWSRPAPRPIADPAGPNWNIGLSSQTDDAPAIQAMIDANPSGVIQLQARAYYLGSSLKFKGATLLIGAGPDKTVLIAKDPNINLIESAVLGQPVAASVAFGVFDLTLQGGNVGLSFAEAGIQSTAFYMSHVTIRNMKTAGIFLNNTYAWDNGYLEYVDFYKNAVGFKIAGTNLPNQESPTNAYMDKVFFYRNQYVENQKALEFNPARQSNMNVWFESSFRGNSVRAIEFNGGVTTTFFVSSDFTDNGGNPSIRSGNSYFVNSSFRAGPAGSFFSNGVICEGCEFARGTSSSAVLFGAFTDADPREYVWGTIVNSTSIDVPMPPLTSSRNSYLFVNNKMAPADSLFSIPFGGIFYDTKGTPDLSDDVRYSPQYWLTGATVPGTKFLRQPQ